MKLAYIIPARAHQGLKIKFDGQKNGFKKLGMLIHEHIVTYEEKNSFLKKITTYTWFEIKTLMVILKNPNIYARYNPKAILSNIWIVGLSPFKTMIIEHNSNYAEEFKILKQPLARLANMFCLRAMSYCPLKHTVVTEGIKHYLVTYGIHKNNIIVIQNGYDLPEIDGEIDQKLVHIITTFKSKFKTIAIFVGSRFKNYGLADIIQICEKQHIGLLIVGPDRLNTTSNCVLQLGYQPYKSIKEIYALADFGFSEFECKQNKIERCPLKVREYLCHGLPVCTKVTDIYLEKIPELQKWIFNISKNPDAIHDIQNQIINKDTIQKIATQHLNWETQLKPVVAYVKNKDT